MWLTGEYAGTFFFFYIYIFWPFAMCVDFQGEGVVQYTKQTTLKLIHQGNGADTPLFDLPK